MINTKRKALPRAPFRGSIPNSLNSTRALTVIKKKQSILSTTATSKLYAKMNGSSSARELNAIIVSMREKKIFLIKRRKHFQAARIWWLRDAVFYSISCWQNNIFPPGKLQPCCVCMCVDLFFSSFCVLYFHPFHGNIRN